MWMMGYNNEGSEFNLPNSFNSHGRKHRPLVPRPTTAISTHNNNATSIPCLSRLHGTDLFAINHHISTVAAEKGKSQREFNTQTVVVSARWNPTPEQLRTLEDLYQRGTRTPSAEQIQHITAQLRQYGKIEGKNVFYWFQNHKARERQKRRRQLIESTGSDKQHHHRDIEGFDRKESGASRTVVFEVEQTKNWPPPTNCSTLAEESVSIERAARGGAVAECRSDDGWVQFDKGELQHSSSSSNRSLVEKNATWQMMQLSCPPPSCSTSTTHHHVINATTTTSCTATATTATETAAAIFRRSMGPSADHDLNNSNIETQYLINFFTTPCNQKNANYLIHDKECTTGESQTLQLFPVGKINEKATADQAMSSDFTTDPPYQYFEFLPLKN